MKEGGGNTAVSSGGFMIPKNEADALTYLNATYDFADSERILNFSRSSARRSWA